MWLLFGGIAIAATAINLYMYSREKDYKLAVALALSCTALAVTADYRIVSKWLREEDWTALLDVVPVMEKVMWILLVYVCC